MAHKQQIEFCKRVKERFPDKFIGSVLDVGSLDINGNNKHLFKRCVYTGVDIVAGKNVDIVKHCHLLNGWSNSFDIVISTEMLEHDKHWIESLKNMYDMVKSGGLLIITCATYGRKPHGVKGSRPSDSPATNDYYRNIQVKDFRKVLDRDSFKDKEFMIDTATCTLMFWGVK